MNRIKPVIAVFFLLLLGAIAASAQGTNEGAPVWTSIPPTAYFKYDQWTQTENQSFSGSYPQTYYFSNLAPMSMGRRRTTCVYQNQTDASHPIYWYGDLSDGFGPRPLQGVFPIIYTPFEYHEAWTGFFIKGLTFKGAFRGGYTGSPNGTAAVQAVFFTDKFCTDGGRELGFFRRLDLGTLPAGSLYFYYSDFTNCEGNVCRKDASFNVDPYPRPDISLKEIRQVQSRYSGNDVFFYSAYLINNATSFRVQVVEPDTVNLASCIPPGETWPRGCTFDVPIWLPNPASFRYPDLSAGIFDHGWLATVVQKIGAPSLSANTSLYVEMADVGK